MESPYRDFQHFLKDQSDFLLASSKSFVDEGPASRVRLIETHQRILELGKLHFGKRGPYGYVADVKTQVEASLPFAVEAATDVKQDEQKTHVPVASYEPEERVAPSSVADVLAVLEQTGVATDQLCEVDLDTAHQVDHTIKVEVTPTSGLGVPPEVPADVQHIQSPVETIRKILAEEPEVAVASSASAEIAELDAPTHEILGDTLVSQLAIPASSTGSYAIDASHVVAPEENGGEEVARLINDNFVDRENTRLVAGTGAEETEEAALSAGGDALSDIDDVGPLFESALDEVTDVTSNSTEIVRSAISVSTAEVPSIDHPVTAAVSTGSDATDVNAAVGTGADETEDAALSVNGDALSDIGEVGLLFDVEVGGVAEIKSHSVADVPLDVDEVKPTARNATDRTEGVAASSNLKLPSASMEVIPLDETVKDETAELASSSSDIVSVDVVEVEPTAQTEDLNIRDHSSFVDSKWKAF
ncbi:hypothetical protein HDU96_000804 [Phlyctochytrium bullatum]|nr:hypothetical protein HDU96_000804 [Phlyctochytrium bullatum]